jgi:hypothetical protein
MASTSLIDTRIDTKFKLSALWAAVMFCYIYGDYFSLYLPKKIEHLMNGESGVGPTTPVNLLLFSVMMSIPSLMIFLSLALKPRVNRTLNIAMGCLFTLIMVMVTVGSIDKWMMFFIYLAVIEITLTAMVVWQAWRWPRE